MSAKIRAEEPIHDFREKEDLLCGKIVVCTNRRQSAERSFILPVPKVIPGKRGMEGGILPLLWVEPPQKPLYSERGFTSMVSTLKRFITLNASKVDPSICALSIPGAYDAVL